MDTLGKRITFLLNQKNLNQKELAKLTGISEVSIGRYINGKREPSASLLFEIASALDTTTDYLLGLSDNSKAMPHSNQYDEETIVLARKLGSLNQGQISLINQMIEQFEQNKDKNDD